MRGCHKIASEPDPLAAPADASRAVVEDRLYLLSWLIDYELRSAERYRRFVALLLLSCPAGRHRLRGLLARTKRECDRLFELDQEYAILMSETDQAGALAALRRYQELGDEALDLRGAVVAFPEDGANCLELLKTLYRRLELARVLERGAVVSSG